MTNAHIKKTLHWKYFRYLHQTNTVVLTILHIITWAKFQVSSTTTTIDYFTTVIYRILAVICSALIYTISKTNRGLRYKPDVNSHRVTLGCIMRAGLKKGGVEFEPFIVERMVNTIVDWLGRSLTSHEYTSGYMRRPCKGHEMGCFWLLLLKPKTGGE